ncbi:MAG TPA: adenylate/guanylate cyclase domain-containing protein [Gemmatimonadota bacterium]|nr:adenylate/guanylate cyclase domain-containing protein [Gemmatimonadota bacterium]
MAFRHRLAAIWFADIVDYTELSASDEPRALGLVGAFQRAARRTVPAYGGRLVKYLGDGALAEFSSSQAAISSAHALLAAFDEEASAAGLPTGRLRIGVHSGEIVESEDGDLYGDGVNVASRIHSKAGEGEIVVSSDVRRQLRQRPEFRFESLGSLDLKGLGSVELFRLQEHQALGPETALERSGWPRALYLRLRRHAALTVFAFSVVVVATIISFVTRDSSQPPPIQADPGLPASAVAVLPFQISGSAPAEWREGMVDLLSTNLDGVAGLRAIDTRTILRRWNDLVGDASPDVREALGVGRSAGARFAVVSRAVGVGPRVRLLAEVYDLSSGERIGQSQTEGPADSVFMLVDRLSIDLLGYLVEGGSRDLPAISLARVTTDSLAALKAFLEGESRFRESSWAAAFETYQRAVKIDSTFALAMFRLGQVAGWGAQGSPVEFYERAIRHVDRMRTRDRLVLQGALAIERGSLQAIEVLEEATRLYPDDAMAWLERGEAYYHLGAQALRSRDDSEVPFNRGLAIDRTFSPAYIHMIDNAFGLYADSARARRLVDAFIDLAPATPEARLYPLGLDLVFGNAASQRRARAVVDTLPLREAVFIARNLLWHPRFLALQEGIYSQHEQSGRLASVRLRRGRLSAALEALEDPSIPPESRAVMLYEAHTWGLPIPASSLEALLGSLAEEHETAVMMFLRGAYAAERGRWERHGVAVRLLETSAEALHRQGDLEAADFAAGAAVALRGYRDLRQARPDQAFAALETARTRATGFSDLGVKVNGIIRRWLAVVARQRKDPSEIQYLESFWGLEEVFSPLARLELARAYERAGKEVAAREAHGEFTAAWAEADPALRERIEGESQRR